MREIGMNLTLMEVIPYPYTKAMTVPWPVKQVVEPVMQHNNQILWV